MTLITPLQPPPSYLHTCKDPLLLNIYPYLKLLVLGLSLLIGKKIHGNKTCVTILLEVYPQFISIPPYGSSSFEPFCWSELLLYKAFRSIPHDIGTTTSEIISHLQQIKGTYTIWHVEHAQEEPVHLYLMIQNLMLLPFRCPITWMNGSFSLKCDQETKSKLMTLKCLDIVILTKIMIGHIKI